MTFVVAAIVNDPPAVLERFVDWYLSQGATEVRLYFDDPDHPAIDAIQSRKQVAVTSCTADFWQSLGVDPEARFTLRQNAALNHAYQQVTDGWFLNVDADELVYAPGKSIAAWLSQKTASQTIRIRTAEFVHGPGPAQHFRLPMKPRAVSRVYREDSDLFRRRWGLIGHVDGKSFHRAGMSDIRLRQHWATDANGDMLVGEILTAQDGIYVLHYMAPDYDQWRAKLEWRLQSHGFPLAIKEKLLQIRARSDDPEPQYRALFDLLHATDKHQVRRLKRFGGIMALENEGPRLH